MGANELWHHWTIKYDSYCTHTVWVNYKEGACDVKVQGLRLYSAMMTLAYS